MQGGISVIIIDEIHEWYSNQTLFIKNMGLSIIDDKIPISGLAMMHWFNKELENNRLHIIGITATPYRIFADTHLRPNKDNIFNLIPDPPQDLQYRC